MAPSQATGTRRSRTAAAATGFSSSQKMVWPVFPIVAYDKLRVAAVATCVAARLFLTLGLPVPLAFLAGPVLTGLYLRFYWQPPKHLGGSLSLSDSQNSDSHNDSKDSSGNAKAKKERDLEIRLELTCTEQNYQARRKEVERIATELVKNGQKLRMFKATASNTFRTDQIDTRAQKEGKLDLSSFAHVIRDSYQEVPLKSEEKSRGWLPSFKNTSENAGNNNPGKNNSEKTVLVDVEASTTFETFVEILNQDGYMPLCVPELRTITVGGAVVGIGIESSSFKHGFFHEGLVEADILLGSGKVVTVSADNEYADLFRAIPNSLGSFGYLLNLRMRVQKIAPVVKITKTWHDSPEAFIKAMEKASLPDPATGVFKNDFVDGVALSTAGGMLVEGVFADSIPVSSELISDYAPPSSFFAGWFGSRPAKQFYRTLLEEGDDYLRTKDYIWRWDADWFWCTQIFPGLSWTPVRYLCGPRLLRSDMYKVFNDKFTRLLPQWLLRNQELVIQDIEVPVEKSAEWIRTHCAVVKSQEYGKIKLTRKGSSSGKASSESSGDSKSSSSSKSSGDSKSSETVPIWLCPVRGTRSPLMPMKDGLYVNFGFWDALEHAVETKGGNAAGTVNRALEKACESHDAIKTLYSSCYYSEEEFYAKYNGVEYKRVKAKYDPKESLRGWFARLRAS